MSTVSSWVCFQAESGPGRASSGTQVHPELLSVTAEKQKSATGGGDQMGWGKDRMLCQQASQQPSSPPLACPQLLHVLPEQGDGTADSCGGAPEMSQVLQSHSWCREQGGRTTGSCQQQIPPWVTRYNLVKAQGSHQDSFNPCGQGL